MAITSKLRRHKVMEATMRALMGNNLPPRFKFRDTYDSIEVPTAYQQYLPSQATLEAKFDELIAEEDVVAPTTEIKADMAVSSNLEVGTDNLFVDTETGRVGIGKTNPASALDVVGNIGVTGTVNGRDLSVDGSKLDNILDASKLKYKTGYTQIDINSPATSSGSWTSDTNTTQWGAPKFDNVYNQIRYGDAPNYVEYTIPSGMKSAYLSHLQWDNGGYTDIHGVQADGDLVFLRRINTKQSEENSNHGNPSQYDGSTITFVGSGLQYFSKIRITCKYARTHISGISFTPNENEGAEGTGLVHVRQISDRGPMVMVGRNAGRVYAGSFIVYNAVEYNTHGLYNSSNGRFTAPTGFPGYYLFTHSGLGGNVEIYPNTRWYRNGSVFDWGAAHVNNSCSSRHGLSTQVIIYLNEGDYVAHYVNDKSLYGSNTIYCVATCTYLGK
jgi:hypothetical protein